MQQNQMVLKKIMDVSKCRHWDDTSKVQLEDGIKTMTGFLENAGKI
jgi:hypothetical protein